jgi:hypothetical protein
MLHYRLYSELDNLNFPFHPSNVIHVHKYADLYQSDHVTNVATIYQGSQNYTCYGRKNAYCSWRSKMLHILVERAKCYIVQCVSTFLALRTPLLTDF